MLLVTLNNPASPNPKHSTSSPQTPKEMQTQIILEDLPSILPSVTVIANSVALAIKDLSIRNQEP